MSSFSAARAQAHMAEDISDERRIIEKAIKSLNTALEAQTYDVANAQEEGQAIGWFMGGDQGQIIGGEIATWAASDDIEKYDLYDFLPDNFAPIHFQNVIEDTNYDAGVFYYDLMNQMAFNPAGLVLDISIQGMMNKEAGKGFWGGKGKDAKSFSWSPAVQGIRKIRDFGKSR